MQVTVLIPARNESATITLLLERVRAALAPYRGEIIVIDDGSSDDTAARAAAVPGVCVIRQRSSRGKGAALRAGLEQARGEFVLIQDADLEYDPADYPALLEPLLAGRAQVVYGSRILGARSGRKTGLSTWYYYLGGRFLSGLTTFLYGARMTDVATGYKVFRTQLLRDLRLACDGFEFCPEATGKLLKQGVSIHEVPIAYFPRSVAEGKKIRWTDGFVAIWTLLRIRLGWKPKPPVRVQ